MNTATRSTLVILKREWLSYFNSPVAYVFIIIFLVLMGFFTFSMSPFFQAGNAELSRSFFFWHPWLYLILVPAISMGLWAEERRSHTIELLLTLPVTITEAVLGKFLAAWLFLLTALALTFPVVLTVTYLGDPDLGVIFSGYVGSALLAGAYLAIGNFTSALTKNQVISFILAVVIGLFLVLAGFPPVTDFITGLGPAWVWLVDLVSSFSFITHFDALMRGVIDFRDVLYFVSVIGLMLFATHVALASKASQ